MATWTIERTANRRFPFRITIEQDGRLLLAVRTQSAWPGPGQQVFCLRETTLDPAEPLEPHERVPVAHLARVGRKLAIVLDRPSRKRCEILGITKTAKDGHTYEQLYFRTESGIRAHRSRTRMELLPAAEPAPITVAIDSAERYPWTFPGATVVRRKLVSGDYALVDGAATAAVVERKTFDGLLGDIGAAQALHHQLADLASHACAALVIEAQYADFLDERHLKGRWPAAHTARVLAELAAMHPKLPIVFAGNRKLANLWCARFFTACTLRTAGPQLDLLRETVARYEAQPRDEDIDTRLRRAALARGTEPFAATDLDKEFPDVKPTRIRRALAQLAAEGLLVTSGRGRGLRWTGAPS